MENKKNTIYFDEIHTPYKETILNYKKEAKPPDRINIPKVKNKNILNLRIRKFRISFPGLKKFTEFGCHHSKIHWIPDAIFHSENGCLYCKKELELQFEY